MNYAHDAAAAADERWPPFLRELLPLASEHNESNATFHLGFGPNEGGD